MLPARIWEAQQNKANINYFSVSPDLFELLGGVDWVCFSANCRVMNADERG